MRNFYRIKLINYLFVIKFMQSFRNELSSENRNMDLAGENLKTFFPTMTDLDVYILVKILSGI